MKKIYIFIVLVITTLTLTAHPHLFAGVDLDFKMINSDSLKICQKWVFDDMTSLIILEDYDMNENGEFDADEISNIEDNVVEGLKDYNFYTDLTLNDRIIYIDEIYDFNVVSDDIYVYYEFNIKIPVSVKEEKQVVKISVYDKEFYTKFFINTSRGIQLNFDKTITSEFKAYENKSKSYYLGQFNPLEIAVTFEMAK